MCCRSAFFLLAPFSFFSSLLAGARLSSCCLTNPLHGIDYGGTFRQRRGWQREKREK